MGWSDSPTSKHGASDIAQLAGGETRHTFQHVLYQNRALDDFLVGMELFIVRSNEKDHCETS
jgi:hypothetical protein